MRNMKKNFLRIAMFLAAMFMAGIANAQIQVAVLDFKAGAGVEQADVDGVSSMFGTYFIDPQKFTLVERTQIDRVIAEQGFQYSALTNQQMVRIGQILNIQKIVVGDITVVSGQYNVDVRIVDVETGAVNATEGATWVRSASYRELMENLATRLMTKMNVATGAVTTNVTPIVTQNTVVTLYGYLNVFPEDLGEFQDVPANVIAMINKDASHGYNDWRIPTAEELALMRANNSKVGLKNGNYMTSDGTRSGNVRLVTNGQTVAAKEKDEADYNAKLSACGIAAVEVKKLEDEDCDPVTVECRCQAGWRVIKPAEIDCLTEMFPDLKNYNIFLRVIIDKTGAGHLGFRGWEMRDGTLKPAGSAAMWHYVNTIRNKVLICVR
jgi:hypothetical protein